MKNVIFIAPPAAGKGTQSDLLKDNLGYVHISTGDLLRELDKESPLGKEVNALIEAGKFVSDEIVLELLKQKLLTLTEDDHFILDGYPRNLNQAEALDGLLKEINKSLDCVIELDVPYDTCLKRAIGREICPNCHKAYNTFFKKPKTEGVCDSCGSTLVHRSDDTEETFKTRFDTYVENTQPLIDYYEKQGKLVKVDGVNDTYEKVVGVVK